jgi:hypothetical protein
MKKLLLALTILLACSTTYSARIGGGTVVIGPEDPDPVGTTYSGTARKYFSGTQWDGTVGYYWHYYHYTRTTMQYCQNEQNVMITNGAQIVTWCHAD